MTPPENRQRAFTVFRELRSGLLQTAVRCNQICLLNQLHETKVCSPLLIPDSRRADAFDTTSEIPVEEVKGKIPLALENLLFF